MAAAASDSAVKREGVAVAGGGEAAAVRGGAVGEVEDVGEGEVDGGFFGLWVGDDEGAGFGYGADDGVGASLAVAEAR